MKEVFSFLNVLYFNLDAFEGMGEVFSIVMGLLVPAWLVLELGLFRERTYFGFWGMTRKNGNIIFLKGLIAGLIIISAIAVSFVCIAEGWINNDLVNALLLVLSSLSFFSFLHQVYLLSQVVEYGKVGNYAQQISIFTEDGVEDVKMLTDKFRNIFGKININVAAGRSPDELAFSGRRSSAMGTMSVRHALEAFTTETVLATKEGMGEAIFERVKDETKFGEKVA